MTCSKRCHGNNLPTSRGLGAVGGRAAVGDDLISAHLVLDQQRRAAPAVAHVTVTTRARDLAVAVVVT